MECEEIRQQLSAYHDGELDAGESDEVQDHLRLCADCARYRDDLEEIDSLLRGVTTKEPAQDFAVRLSELVKPSRSPGFFSKTLESTLASLDSFFELAVGPKYRKTATLDEFGDFPPLSIGHAYFHLLGHNM
jgi:anti-sigma factor RsiW